jgi:hypothetical protein
METPLSQQYPQEYHDLLPLVLARTASADEQARFDALLSEHPVCKQDFEREQASFAMFDRHHYQLQSQHQWQQRADRIMQRVEALGVAEQAEQTDNAAQPHNLRLAHQMQQAQQNEYATRNRQRSHTRILVWRCLQAAALVLVGFGAGRWFEMQSQSLGTNNQPYQMYQTRALANQPASHSTNQELQGFLEQSHLILLGVMNLSAECGANAHNPNTLFSQRQRCVSLLLTAQRVKHHLAGQGGLSGDRERLAHLVANIELALSEIAAAEPHTLNQTRIKQIQRSSDNALCELSSTLAAN